MRASNTYSFDNFDFILLPDKSVILRTVSGFCPVAVFSVHLKIDGVCFDANFALDNNGHVVQCNCPFEKIAISLGHQDIAIQGAAETISASRGNKIQGVITALVPAPKGRGNQYVVFFINQISLDKGRICYYSGMDKDLYTIYNSLTVMTTDSKSAAV